MSKSDPSLANCFKADRELGEPLFSDEYRVAAKEPVPFPPILDRFPPWVLEWLTGKLVLPLKELYDRLKALGLIPAEDESPFDKTMRTLDASPFVDSATGLTYLPQTGDVLLYHRQTLIGGVITAVTGGDRSHAGIVVVEPGRAWYVGAEAAGIVARPLANEIKCGSRIKVRRVRYPNVHPGPDGWEKALADAALNVVGLVRYSYEGFFAGLYYQLVDPNAKPDPRCVPDKMMCSQFASMLLRVYRKYDPCAGATDAGTSPNDLDEALYLETACEELALR